MGKRRKAREIVLQVLYEAEFSDRTVEEILQGQIEGRHSGEETVGYARELLARVHEHMGDLDARIAVAVSNWDIERLSLIDKNILRFAMAEMLFLQDVPTRVIINEAIEIAHKYSSSDAGRFINGILDAFAQKYRQDTA